MQVLFTTKPVLRDPVLSWEDTPYVAPWRDAAVLESLPAGAWDGPVVRLVRLSRQEDHSLVLKLQPARYFDYIGTNLSPRDCERVDAIGVCALLFTADGACILQRRAADLAIRPGLLGPSMSGTLEPDDLRGATHLSEIDAAREVCEELGVSRDEIELLNLMGMIREPERHGAPELLYRGSLTLTAAELSTRQPTEGSLLLVDILDIHRLPDRTPPLNNLMALLIREDMGR